MTQSLALLAVLSLVCGCAQIDDIKAQKAADDAAHDDQLCQHSGLKPGTQPYTDCRAMLDTQRQAEDKARRLGNMVTTPSLIAPDASATTRCTTAGSITSCDR